MLVHRKVIPQQFDKLPGITEVQWYLFNPRVREALLIKSYIPWPRKTQHVELRLSVHEHLLPDK